MIYNGTKIVCAESMDRARVTEPVSLVTMPQTTDVDPLGEESVFIREIVQKCSDGTLSDHEHNERDQLFLLLQSADLHDVFVCNKTDLGHKIQHKINTGHSTPIQQQFWRVTPSEARRGQNVSQRHATQRCHCALPIVHICKKDSSCINYRKINAITRKDAYPCPVSTIPWTPLLVSKCSALSCKEHMFPI